MALARLDVLLDDIYSSPRSCRPSPRRSGRPSTPMETTLRFLKLLYRLGHESCREVSDSVTWRRFCRIGIDHTEREGQAFEGSSELGMGRSGAVGAVA
jgi:transposase, IS5 family